MSYRPYDFIYVVSTTTGYIPAFRQQGPIHSPLKVTVATARKAIISGVILHQFDPISGKVLRLTLQNLMDDTKFDQYRNTTKSTTETASAYSMRRSVAVEEETGVEVSSEEASTEASTEEITEETADETASKTTEEEAATETEHPTTEATTETTSQTSSSTSKKKKK